MDSREMSVKDDDKATLFKKKALMRAEDRSPTSQAMNLRASLQVSKLTEPKSIVKNSERVIPRSSNKITNLPLKSGRTDNIKPMMSDRQMDYQSNAKSIRKGSENASQKTSSRLESPSRSNAIRSQSKNSANSKSRSLSRKSKNEAKNFRLAPDQESKLSVNNFISIRNGYFYFFPVPENRITKSLSFNPASFSLFISRCEDSSEAIKHDKPEKFVKNIARNFQQQNEGQTKNEFQNPSIDNKDRICHTSQPETMEKNQTNNLTKNSKDIFSNSPNLFNKLLVKQESLRDMENDFSRRISSSRRDWSEGFNSDFQLNKMPFQMNNTEQFFPNNQLPSFASGQIQTFHKDNVVNFKTAFQKEDGEQRTLFDKYTKTGEHHSSGHMSVSSDFLSLRSSHFDSTYFEDNIKSLNLFLDIPSDKYQSDPSQLLGIEPKQINESIRSIESNFDANPNHDCYKNSNGYPQHGFETNKALSNEPVHKDNFFAPNPYSVGKEQDLAEFNYPQEFGNNTPNVEPQSPGENRIKSRSFNSDRFQSNPVEDNSQHFNSNQTNDEAGEDMNLRRTSISLPSNFSSFKELEPLSLELSNPFSREFVDNELIYSQTQIQPISTEVITYEESPSPKKLSKLERGSMLNQPSGAFGKPNSLKAINPVLSGQNFSFRKNLDRL
jgi:hypothetical protein